jgi:RNA polymerase sigma-70 factor, ECF subfamily
MAMPPDPDAALMFRVKNGDLAAFEAIVEKYKQPIINLMYRMLHDLDEAEGLAQSVFVRVYQAADRYETSAKFSTWLFTIARNSCLNEIRRRSRHPAESMDAADADDEHPARQFPDARAASATDALLGRELEEKIQEALDALPEKQRLAVLMCRQEDQSYEEIAQALGTSVSATKSLIHRGRETLKQKLKPYLRSGQWPQDSRETPPRARC